MDCEGVHTRAKLIPLIAFCAHLALAHPMGNFSISHYGGLHLQRGSVDLRYVIDMAEIPTFQEMQQSGLTARPDDPGLGVYLKATAALLAKGLALTLNGQVLDLRPVSEDAIFPAGAGNLPTMKLGVLYRATFPRAPDQGEYRLSYQDTNFPGRAGWKEIVTSVGPGIRLAGGFAPQPDRSSMLSNYPTGLLNSPPQDLALTVAFKADSTADRTVARRSSPPALRKAAPKVVSAESAVPQRIQLQPNRQATPRNAFTELMAGQPISLGMIWIAALVAAGLGALHALEPGHGKTIVAAYLVGSKGTARHAFLLGLIVTISHTAGVYLLGGVTLYAQKYVVPDRLYPFLSVLSGMLIAGMGLYLFLQRFAGADFSHSHSHGHSHATGKMSGRQLTVLGITGGMVPCPAALIVLLSAAALHRVAFGLFLIVAFSVGLATVLIVMGLAAVYAGRLMSRVRLDGALMQRWLPASSAAIITTLGFVIAIRGLVAAGIVQIRI